MGGWWNYVWLEAKQWSWPDYVQKIMPYLKGRYTFMGKVAVKCLILEKKNMHTLNMTVSQQMQVKGLIWITLFSPSMISL